MTRTAFFTTFKSKLQSDVTFELGTINTFLNPYSYLILRKTPKLIQKIDNVFIDGISFVIVLRILGIKVCSRQSFDMTTIAKKTFEYAEKNQKSIFFVGTKPEIIEKSISQIQAFYPKLPIAGFSHGYFKTNEEISLLHSRIINTKCDIVVVGTGTPRQEQFLIDLKQKGWKGVGFTCGGFLHQIAEKLHYYPSVIDKFHMRWIFRIADEPKLLKRYVFDYSFFLVIFVKDLISSLRQ